MKPKIEKLVNRLMQAVLGSGGQSDLHIRQQINQLISRSDSKSSPNIQSGPLLKYVEKVAHHPYKIMDEDFTQLTDDGFSEEEIFEFTVTAAVSAGMLRLQSGLSLLQQKE